MLRTYGRAYEEQRESKFERYSVECYAEKFRRFSDRNGFLGADESTFAQLYGYYVRAE
jgi:hypothetical protein